jgi:DNA mismatch endonuclease (patch repair protein)
MSIRKHTQAAQDGDCSIGGTTEDCVLSETTSPERSRQMALVRGKDTKPEMVVRRIVHRLGYRYRLHRSDLPGKPDLVFSSRRKVILVHGCFWHRHTDPTCKLARMPKSRLEFWEPKLAANSERDARALEALRRAGWSALILWECEIGSNRDLEGRITQFLES